MIIVGSFCMTNIIPKIEQKDSAFSEFQITKKTPDYYWQKTTLSEDKNDEFVVKNEDNQIIMTPAQARKTNNLNKIGLSIAGTMVFAAGIVFFLLTGGPKGVARGFNNLSQYFERLILESNMNTKTTPNKILLYLHNATNNIVKYIEALNNFTSFKDMLFTKIMGVTSFTEKIHKKITNVFEKIGLREVKSKYKSTDKKFEQTNNLLDALSKRLTDAELKESVKIGDKTKTKAQWLEEIKKLNEEINSVYAKNFDESARIIRYNKMQGIVKDLLEQFNDMKIFLSWDTLTKFIAESAIAKDKMTIQKSTDAARNVLTYTLKDMAKSSNNLILDMVKLFGYKDTKNIEALGKIRGQINEYLKFDGKDLLKKPQINLGIRTLKNDVQTAISNHTIDEKTGNAIIEKLEKLANGLNNFEEGKIQKVLNICKEILPEQNYKVLKESYESEIKSLDKSIKTETEDFMSKLRDLTLGSAPTDILTILASFGILGFQLSQSKDKEHRQSILLKYGFPAIAGIGVSLYCNAKLYAGTKSLLIGAVSSWVLNRIGEVLDKNLKNYKTKNNITSSNNNNKPIAQSPSTNPA